MMPMQNMVIAAMTIQSTPPSRSPIDAASSAHTKLFVVYMVALVIAALESAFILGGPRHRAHHGPIAVRDRGQVNVDVPLTHGVRRERIRAAW